jgi:acyl-CoA thioester hydrolase
MTELVDVLNLRVRYSETDQMGTFYNSRALEWFECGRTELMRNRLGLSYAELEARGVFLPLVEAHLEFKGRARYDDLLRIESRASLAGRARLRFEVRITQSDSGAPVVNGWTVHAFVDGKGRPSRPPYWLAERMEKAA